MTTFKCASCDKTQEAEEAPECCGAPMAPAEAAPAEEKKEETAEEAPAEEKKEEAAKEAPAEEPKEEPQ